MSPRDLNLFGISIVNSVCFRKGRCHTPISFLNIVKCNGINVLQDAMDERNIKTYIEKGPE